jgi:hypothetical protein
VAPFLVTVVTSCGGPKAENTEMIKLILDLSSNPKTIRPTETSIESGRQFFDYGDTKLGGQTKWFGITLVMGGLKLKNLNYQQMILLQANQLFLIMEWSKFTR